MNAALEWQARSLGREDVSGWRPVHWKGLLAYGHHEKSALPRPLANADAGLDMSLNRYFQGKPVFFVVPLLLWQMVEHHCQVYNPIPIAIQMNMVNRPCLVYNFFQLKIVGMSLYLRAGCF